ncbi:MAG: hypothetical protein LBB89_04895 [Treponema sp.]|jgi:hypothetical protein|nr:hypothetical protein [Treponema sp.]
MKKRVFPRIVCFVLLNGVTFVLLVMMQFTRGGNFSQKIGDILINGRYSSETNMASERQLLDGGANVSFGGLEFRLASKNKNTADIDFCLVDSQGGRRQIFPEYITFMEDGAVFILPGGAELSFTSHNYGETSGEKPDGMPEFRISGKFSDNVSAIEIPFRTQRSSVIRDNGNNTLTIVYNGSHYQFNRFLHELESGQLVLSAAASTISYRAVTGKKEFNPADFIVPQAESAQVFSETVSRWVSRNFALWGQMGFETDEDTVLAWCSEAVRQGVYRSAVSVIPVSFSSNPRRSWESAVYQFDRKIGVWETAARAMNAFEREKINRISRLLAEKEIGLFTENHLIEFLAIRGRSQLIDNLISFAQEINPSTITLEAGPGILESCLDTDVWRPHADNPFEPLAEQICRLAADDMHRVGDRVFVFSADHADTEFNVRLGTAIHKWGEKSGNSGWAGLGRSLVLSVFSLGDNNGLLPASLTIDKTGEIISPGARISTARVYQFLNNSEYFPHAMATGANDIWAWTAASSVSIVQDDRQMDIAIQFPVGETHYVMLNNVKPFPLLQIYEMNWRRAFDFESYYNSSGWYYFEQEQILVLKINHRSNVEHVKIYFTVPRAPETSEQPVQEQPASTEYREQY